MLVVRVELWSAVTSERSEIARMVIDNVGGTTRIGDYRVRTCRGRSEADLQSAMRKGVFTREGRVIGHRRLALHVWHLVGKALLALDYVHPKSTPAIPAAGAPSPSNTPKETARG